MNKMTTLVAVLLLTVFGAGCKDNRPPANGSQGKLIDACALIDKAQAMQLMGEPLADAEKKENKVVGQQICLYNSANQDSFRLFQISLTQQAFMPANGQSPQSIYEATRANFPDGIKVDGVGDDAFIAPPGLHILKDNYYITIAVGNSDDPENQKILKAAGKIAVENLVKLEPK